MKLLRSAVVVVAVLAIIASMTGASFAMEKSCKGMQGKCCKDMQEKCGAKIKALKDSAAALQKTNPELAKGLNDLAAEKEKMLQEITDMKAKHEAKVKMLRDSAAVLQKSNPDLAKELWDMSEYKHMGEARHGEKKGPAHMMKRGEDPERHGEGPEGMEE